jgi:uncharacterized protein YicC (UPF0701 family)
MAEQQTFDRVPNFTFSPRAEGIDPNAKIDLVGSMINISSEVSEHGTKLADHDGQLKSFSSVVSSIQSTLSAWVMVAGVIATVGALVAALEFYNSQKIDGAATKSDLAQKADRLDQRMGQVDTRIEEIGKEVKALPAAIAARLGKKPQR